MGAFEQVNRRPESAFPVGFRFYDEGVLAFEVGKPFTSQSSRSWRDGWHDARLTAERKILFGEKA